MASNDNSDPTPIYENTYARVKDGATTTSFGPHGSDSHVDKPNGHMVVKDGQIEHFRSDDGGGKDGKGTVLIDNGEWVK